MGQTRDEIAQNLAERLCWQVARRDDSGSHGACTGSRWSTGSIGWTKGPCCDDFFYFLHQLGVVDLLGHVQGTAVQREMVPFVQYVLLYSL
jgi:hypothetical protein